MPSRSAYTVAQAFGVALSIRKYFCLQYNCALLPKGTKQEGDETFGDGASAMCQH